MGIFKKTEGWLFPSSKTDSHISGRSVKNRFDKILKDNNICLANRKKHERDPCLHCLRHVFAFKSFAQAERAGRHIDDAIPYLSIYLGHDSLNETSKYLKFSSELFPKQLKTLVILCMTCCRRWAMKHKKNSFLDLLEAYFNTYLPVAKGLSPATVTSYKATF